MTIMKVASFAAGQWVAPGKNARPIHSAITGARIAEAGGGSLDMQAMLDHGRDVGGANLRKMGSSLRRNLRKLRAIGASVTPKLPPIWKSR